MTQAASSQPSVDELRERIALSCQILAQHGLVKGSTGHVSTREPGTDNILIRGRPRGDRGLRFAEPGCVMRVDLEGTPVGDNGNVNRVSEIYLHTDLYKYRPDVNAVIHAHPAGRPALHDEPGGTEAHLQRLRTGGHAHRAVQPGSRLRPLDHPAHARGDLTVPRSHGAAQYGDDAGPRHRGRRPNGRRGYLARADAREPRSPELAGPPGRRRARHLRRGQGGMAAARPGILTGRPRRRGWNALVAMLEHGALRADSIGLGAQFG